MPTSAAPSRSRGESRRGADSATIATVNLADLLFLRGVEAPLSMSKETVTLAPIRGRVAGGTATGDLIVHLKGGFRYVANLELKGANVKTLLAEARSTAGLSGTLAAKGTFEGSGGLLTMKGRGEGTITDCRVEHGRTLALLAGILQVPELASPDFDECRAEFTQSGYRLSTPVLSLKGTAVQLTGRGTVDLATNGLDYRDEPRARPQALRQGHPPRAAAGVPAAGRRLLAIDFRLYGTTLDPQTDLLSRIGKGGRHRGRQGPAQPAASSGRSSSPPAAGRSRLRRRRRPRRCGASASR